MMTAARHWHSLNEGIKCAWKMRAVKQSVMPVPGQFCGFPKEVSKIPRMDGNRMLEEVVLDSLGGDWEIVSKVINVLLISDHGLLILRNSIVLGRRQ
eukprot:10345666-Ditylum_brightwellii.AAC.1